MYARSRAESAHGRQVSGHIYDEEGKKVLALSGAWNSHLDMVKCDGEGDPLQDAKTVRLWQVSVQWPAICRPCRIHCSESDMCAMISLSVPVTARVRSAQQ